MNNFKRLIAVMMVLAVALCVVACTQPQENPGTTTTQTPPPSSSSSEPSSSSKPADPVPTYVVYVVDQDGNAVVGARVLLCDDNMCYLPVTTDDAGIANFYQENITGAAKTMVAEAEGYTFSSEYTYFAEGENTITLTITKNAE